MIALNKTAFSSKVEASFQHVENITKLIKCLICHNSNNKESLYIKILRTSQEFCFINWTPQHILQSFPRPS